MGSCDLSRFAIHTTRKRLLGIAGLRPFVVQNLGKYERQVWQMAEFGETRPQGRGVSRVYSGAVQRRPVSDIHGSTA